MGRDQGWMLLGILAAGVGFGMYANYRNIKAGAELAERVDIQIRERGAGDAGTLQGAQGQSYAALYLAGIPGQTQMG